MRSRESRTLWRVQASGELFESTEPLGSGSTRSINELSRTPQESPLNEACVSRARHPTMSSTRPRDPFTDPPIPGPRQHGRMPSESRKGYEGSINTNTSVSSAGITRAQRFEDEKRRIIESCFSKKDANGSQVESYITHIQITEDALYPSSPPPPDSGSENKKSRVIVVAVRNSGRVRVHKARENNSGTFSIGKTWYLDELISIQSWTSASAASAEIEQQKLWASDVGFSVTLGKPYYWQAATSREREFS